MKSKKIRDFLPLLILALVQLYTLYAINTQTTVVDSYNESYAVTTIHQVVDSDKFYIGVAAVIVCFAAMIINPRVGKWATVATLIAGVANLLEFFPVSIIFDFSFNGIGVEFQAFSFWVLILFTALNFSDVKRILRRLLQKESASGPPLA